MSFRSKKHSKKHPKFIRPVYEPEESYESSIISINVNTPNQRYSRTIRFNSSECNISCNVNIPGSKRNPIKSRTTNQQKSQLQRSVDASQSTQPMLNAEQPNSDKPQRQIGDDVNSDKNYIIASDPYNMKS
jgi:hypothetical protein